MRGTAAPVPTDAGSAVRPCDVCGAPMREERRLWQFLCSSCGFRAARAVHESEATFPTSTTIDEQARHAGLEALRRANFERVLDALSRHHDPRGRALLDVGSAHGWFLEAATRRGYAATGIEPDAGMYAYSTRRGHDVALGLFPEALDSDAVFDVLVFNDVFEHLPDVNDALDSCRDLLRTGGLLALNLPSSRGPIFRASTLLDRLGVRGPLDRLWQRRFPSPHLSYFTPECLAALVRRYGFRELSRGDLPAIGRDGLWRRLRYDRTASLPASVLAWCAVTLAVPVLGRLPSDITLQIFAKEAEAGRRGAP